MAKVTEIAPDVFRISTYLGNLQFNQFLILDDEPLLFHTGLKKIFADVQEAVATLVKPARIRWIGFSHVEADECGSMIAWQALAPEANAVCSQVGKNVSVDDFIAARPAMGMADGELLVTGKYRYRFLRTPQVPHAWDAGLLFEETNATLFCSDLFHQNGDVEPLTTADVVGRFRQTLLNNQQGPFSGYFPYTDNTEVILLRLEALKPKTLATMHGSTFSGDGEQALKDLSSVMKEVLAGPQPI